MISSIPIELILNVGPDILIAAIALLSLFSIGAATQVKPISSSSSSIAYPFILIFSNSLLASKTSYYLFYKNVSIG